MPASIFSEDVRTLSSKTEDELFLDKLKKSYPDFSFKPGKKFLFRPKKTIFYVSGDKNFKFLLLHELAHATLGHFSYETSLERLKIERDAWAETKNLCKKFSVPFSDPIAEAELDTYRDWVHQKTLCKTCGLTCLEVNSESLFCPHCQKYQKRV